MSMTTAELARTLHRKIESAPGLQMKLAVVASVDTTTKTAYINMSGSTTNIPASYITVPGTGSTVLVLERGGDIVVISTIGNGRRLNLREMGVPTTGDAAPAIQAIINASKPGDIFEFDRWFSIGTMLRFKEEGRAYVGSDKMFCGLKQLPGSNLTALACAESWFNNTADHGSAMTVHRLGFDGVRASNTSAHGIIVMNWPTHVEDCYFTGLVHNGVLMTTARQDNTVITGKLQEIYICDNKFDDFLLAPIRGLDFSGGGKLNDGYITGNIIWGGDYGIYMDCSAGWNVSNNHAFGQTKDGIRLQNCFATIVTGNYVEQYGLEKLAGGYYYGIVCTLLAGRPTTVANNQTYSATPISTGGGNIRGITLFALTSQATGAISTGNAHCGQSYALEIAFSYEYQTGATMSVAASNNYYQNVVTSSYVQGAGISFKEVLMSAFDLQEDDKSFSPPNANRGRLFTRDNGSGKTQLCVIFATGSAIVLATEP